MSTSPSSPRSGQAVVFLLLAFTALVFVLLFNVDLHRIIQRKDQTQNAGDAAALAAARWQGATLNLVGELNLLHVLALAAQTPAAVDAITNMQARLCFTGPLTALFAAQIAAKNNHIYVDPDGTELINLHLDSVKASPEPWPNAWAEYETMLNLITSDGIAASPGNIPFYNGPGGHMLFERAFYEAIDSRNWCWFYLHARGLLNSYGSYHEWPPLPEPDANDIAGVIYGLGLRPFFAPMKQLFSAADLETFIKNANLDPVSAAELAATNVMDVVETWYGFDRQDWTTWDRIATDGEDGFPITGSVRPEYDYAGADAVVGVCASVSRMTPGIDGGNRSDKVLWSAAAKPFGYLETDTSKARPDSAAAFVLPAFRDVRLIPIDAASGSQNSAADIDWIRHTVTTKRYGKSHVEIYLELGPRSSGCRYCQALVVWENPAFRKTGIDWLALFCQRCIVPSHGGGGGGHRGGGSRRGH
ncbi:MAG: pilus assembly protein TadG-related protein [bacterium]